MRGDTNFKGSDASGPSVYILILWFKNSLIIHEENTKKNRKCVVSLYVIEISLALHKL